MYKLRLLKERQKENISKTSLLWPLGLGIKPLNDKPVYVAEQVRIFGMNNKLFAPDRLYCMNDRLIFMEGKRFIGHEIYPIEFRYISYISVDYGINTGTLTLHTPGLRNKRWRIEGMPKEVLVRISDFIHKFIRPQPGVEFDPGDISKVTPGIRINPSQQVYPYYPYPPGNPNYPPQYHPQPFSSPDDERITDYQAGFLTYVFQDRKRTKILCDELFGPNTKERIKIIIEDFQ